MSRKQSIIIAAFKRAFRISIFVISLAVLCAVPRGTFANAGVLPFRDTDGWYREAIEYNAAIGIVQGTDEQTFSPNAPITQAMAVTILGRLSEVCGESIDAFTNEESWYVKYADWAIRTLIFPEQESPFIPDKTVTREAFAVYLCNLLDYLEISPPELSGWFIDTDKWSDYQNPMPLQENGLGCASYHSQWAWSSYGGLCATGIILGYPNNMDFPRAIITRAEVCQLLMRVCQQYLIFE